MAQVTTMTRPPKTSLRPLYDRVLVQRVGASDDKHGRILIPESAREKPHEGTVIAVGAGRFSESGTSVPLTVKVGDRILFGKYSGSEIRLDGQEYLIMKEEDLLGILGT
jgi:chaperonin GroES